MLRSIQLEGKHRKEFPRLHQPWFKWAPEQLLPVILPNASVTLFATLILVFAACSSSLATQPTATVASALAERGEADAGVSCGRVANPLASKPGRRRDAILFLGDDFSVTSAIVGANSRPSRSTGADESAAANNASDTIQPVPASNLPATIEPSLTRPQAPFSTAAPDPSSPVVALPGERLNQLRPRGQKVLNVPKLVAPIRVDGRLDEAVWEHAVTAEGFWISEQQRPPAEQTEVFVWADEQTLYFGFRVHEHDPKSIEALQTRRGEGLGVDDQVTVELDPFFNRREISSYSVNARGTQHDFIAGGRADNIAWKGDWSAAAVRTDYGWSAEIAIPVRTLNFDSGASVFGVNFLRYHNRTREWSRWADTGIYNRPEEMGRLVGLALPARLPQHRWTFMPYLLVGRNTADSRGVVRDGIAAAGLEVRYQPKPNATAVLSLHPDFSLIESEVTNINFSYTEKVRRDPRPFFQEGAAYFAGEQYLYTNRIPNFEAGVKYFARSGGEQVALLATQAADRRRDAALRFVQEHDASHSTALTVVGSDRPGLKNLLGALQINGREPSGFYYNLDSAATSTGQAGEGAMLKATAGLQRNHWTVGATLDRYGAGYFPANGLLKADLPGTRGFAPFASYYRDMGEGPIRLLTGDLVWAARDTADGRTQLRSLYAGSSAELRAGTRFSVAYSAGSYRPLTGGRFGDQMNDDRYLTTSVDFNTRSSRLQYGASQSIGRLGGGDYSYRAAYVYWRPVERLRTTFTVERVQSFGSSSQWAASAQWYLSETDYLIGRVVSYDGVESFRIGYGHRVRRSADVFALVQKSSSTAPQVAVKFSFAF